MKKKLLIVDDSQFMRKCIIFALKNEPYEIIECSSGYEALALYQEHKPNLVSLDVTMEGMDGIRTLSELMKIDKEASVVICSSVVHGEVREKAMESGAKSFIRKPFQNEEYRAVIRKYM